MTAIQVGKYSVLVAQRPEFGLLFNLVTKWMTGFVKKLDDMIDGRVSGGQPPAPSQHLWQVGVHGFY